MGLLLVFCVPVPIDLFYRAVLEAQKPAQHLPIRCDFFGDHVHSGEFHTYHRTNIYVIKSIHSNVTPIMYRADSTLAPSQWETSLQSNAVSHWLGTNPQSADSIGLRPAMRDVVTKWHRLSLAGCKSRISPVFISVHCRPRARHILCFAHKLHCLPDWYIFMNSVEWYTDLFESRGGISGLIYTCGHRLSSIYLSSILINLTLPNAELNGNCALSTFWS